MTRPLRAVLQVRNNRIMKAREALGHTTAASACRASGISPSLWAELESMKVSPLCRNGSLRKTALLMSAFLGHDPEYLWPETVLNYEGPRKAEREFTPSMSLLEGGVGTPEQFMLRAEAEEEVDQALKEINLTPREWNVVTQRFGLFGYQSHTLAAVADALGVSCQRIREIEHKALRKMQCSEKMQHVYQLVTGRPMELPPLLPWEQHHYE